MALYLEKTLYNLDVVRYHRIGKVYLKENNVITATLESFRNYEDRLISNVPLNSMDFTFQGLGPSNYPTGQSIIQEGYNYIKSLPEWEEALDV